jgi:hypothetical protein
MKAILKNKKGDVPVMVLVIGVLAICGLAIMSFSINIGNARSTFSGVSIVEKASFEIEKYNFYNLDEIDPNVDDVKTFFDIKRDKEREKYFIDVSDFWGEVSVRYYLEK